MSIPPLVCSTPPPPDQCEDDKDPGDFDIPYNLSQEDDDDDDSYGYGDFSSYNHYQSTCTTQTKKNASKNEKEINIHEVCVDEIIGKNQSEYRERDQHNLFGTNTTNENKPKCEEETNKEDEEDLGLEVNDESISSSEKDDEQCEVESQAIENSDKISDVQTNADKESDTLSNSSSADKVVETIEIDCKEELSGKPVDDPSTDLDVQVSDPISLLNDEICTNDLSIEENSEEPNLDDSFGDFDDFQFASSERKVSDIIEKCDNPWDTNEVSCDDNFGNFTANFDSIERHNSPVGNKVDLHKKDDLELKDTKNDLVNDDDDDFGDFDDFKSSAVDNALKEATIEPEPEQNMQVLNFHTSDNEHQVMERITNVLTSVFEIEISEPETEFKGKLESMLSETWGHLRETDVRQPYIINWNNSLGQKTLLKALCIDSRNILFGPKWGYNMPKYAVNLSVAPLQPQKPLTPAYPCQAEAVSSEKTTAKSSGWTDPFTADGQESCNTENVPVVEVTASDLDVFEAALSTKQDKIYSSTLNVQPLRQISLPDTHIFTPTDSETPTSKTVHYDSGPSILLAQTVLDDVDKTGISTASHKNDTPDDKNDDDDYWEFQDFKSSSEKPSNTKTVPVPQSETKIDNVALKPNVTYQTQVLQPIKMEPLIPTVNWPDPGEIKETFEDYSDFVSNSNWSDKPQEPSPIPVNNKTIPETDILNKITDKHKNVEIENEKPKLNNKDYDDDFDTFQSALPPKSISDFTFDKINNIPSQNASEITADFNNAFPKNKSEVISVNVIRPHENLALNQGNQSNTRDITANKSPIALNTPLPNLLQPMPVTSNLQLSQSKQKTGQILQPLSLESYSQINWPNPGIDLQDLSRFNPVETLQSLKSDLSVGGPSKLSSPIHNQKNPVNNQVADDDIWGEFVSSKPKQSTIPKKPSTFVDDDEWTDFVSSPSVKPQNGLNTISLNVHTNSNIQKSSNLNKFPTKTNQIPLEIPTLNYITPKTSGQNSYNDRHFQNL